MRRLRFGMLGAAVGLAVMGVATLKGQVATMSSVDMKASPVDMKALRAQAEKEIGGVIYDRVGDIPGYERAPLEKDLEALIRPPVQVNDVYVFNTYKPAEKLLERHQFTVEGGQLRQWYHTDMSRVSMEREPRPDATTMPAVRVKAGDEAAMKGAAAALARPHVSDMNEAGAAVEKFKEGWYLVRMPVDKRSEGRRYYTVLVNPAGEVLDVMADPRVLHQAAAEAFGAAKTDGEHAAAMKLIVRVYYPWMTVIESVNEIPKEVLAADARVARAPFVPAELEGVVRPAFRASEKEEVYVCYAYMTGGQTAALGLIRFKFYFEKGRVERYESMGVR